MRHCKSSLTQPEGVSSLPSGLSHPRPVSPEGGGRHRRHCNSLSERGSHTLRMASPLGWHRLPELLSLLRPSPSYTQKNIFHTSYWPSRSAGPGSAALMASSVLRMPWNVGLCRHHRGEGGGRGGMMPWNAGLCRHHRTQGGRWTGRDDALVRWPVQTPPHSGREVDGEG